MDYLIAGLGLGAVLAIIGFCLRELALVRPSAVPVWSQPTGWALMFASLIIWLITAAAFATGLDDGQATQIVAGASLVALIGSLSAGWFLTRVQQPAAQPVRQRQRDRSAVAPEPLQNVSAAPETPVARVAAPRRQPGEGQDEVVEEPAPVHRSASEWRALWRETWGSDAIPFESGTVAADTSQTQAPAAASGDLEDRGSGQLAAQPGDQDGAKPADLRIAANGAAASGERDEDTSGEAGDDDDHRILPFERRQRA